MRPHQVSPFSTMLEGAHSLLPHGAANKHDPCRRLANFPLQLAGRVGSREVESMRTPRACRAARAWLTALHHVRYERPPPTGAKQVREQSVIRNPLTVIAIFAGIAEVSGTIVLPLLPVQHQTTFMWFVMGFPCLLVSMFFATLWKKHEVLYAPSDFRDDSGFLEAQRRRTEIAALRDKFIEDIEFSIPTADASNSVEATEEASPPSSSTNKPTPTPTAPPSSPMQPPQSTPESTRAARGTYLLAERAVLNRLQKEVPGEYSKDTVLIADDAVYAFDATFQGQGFMIGVDVKYVPGTSFNKGLLRSQLAKLDSFYKKMPSEAKSEFRMILAVATDAPQNDQRLIWDSVSDLAKRFSVPIDVRVYDMRVLEEELGGY